MVGVKQLPNKMVSADLHFVDPGLDVVRLLAVGCENGPQVGEVKVIFQLGVFTEDGRPDLLLLHKFLRLNGVVVGESVFEILRLVHVVSWPAVALEYILVTWILTPVADAQGRSQVGHLKGASRS